MRIYPDTPSLRLGLVLRDAVLIVGLIVLAKIGLVVHDAVDKLAVLGEGVQSAGNAVSGAFDSAGDAVDGTPLIGGSLGDALRGAGEGSGGQLTELGVGGENAVHDLAKILGLVVFGLPATILLFWLVPPRLRGIRRLNAAARVLREPETEGRREHLAARAAYSLPYGVLLRYTDDPIGDLRAGRYDALVRAELEEAGLRAPR